MANLIFELAITFISTAINCVPNLTFKLAIAFISIAIDNSKIG